MNQGKYLSKHKMPFTEVRTLNEKELFTVASALQSMGLFYVRASDFNCLTYGTENLIFGSVDAAVLKTEYKRVGKRPPIKAPLYKVFDRPEFVIRDGDLIIPFTTTPCLPGVVEKLRGTDLSFVWDTFSDVDIPEWKEEETSQLFSPESAFNFLEG